MSTEVSIIMNSYNKYPMNLFSLMALKYQTFDPSKMEVIFVDDASSDRTPKLSRFQAPFPFRYIRSDKNLGRSAAKNVGIAAASGKIIIMLDAEMLVHRRYVERHYRYHSQEDNLVVTGCMGHNGMFSVLHPAFNKTQFKHFYSLIRKRPLLRKKWRLTSWSRRRNIRKLAARIQKRSRPVRLLKEEAIKNRKFLRYTFSDPLRPEVLRKFGSRYEGYHLPWYCVVTHSLSFRRSLYEEVGPFYEGFEGWGFEDWEFGYRLFKHGAKFLDDGRTPIYHQEHPTQPYASIKSDNYKNYRKFYQRHRDFEVGIHTLLLLGIKDFVSINDLVSEYKDMTSDSTEKYQMFLNTSMTLFEKIADRFVNEQPIKNLSDVLFEEQPGAYEAFQNELSLLREEGRFPGLVESFQELLER
ncbi:glycosyltransferase [Paenibacillus sp. CC-CFT747]|nr:glycosyltransferase [Paenibacillus sp. CC-CFT747]